MSVKRIYIFTLERDERPRMLLSGSAPASAADDALLMGMLELATGAMDKVGGLVLTAKVARSQFSVLVSGGNAVLGGASAPLNKGRDVEGSITIGKDAFRGWLQSVGYGPMDEDRIRLWLQDCLVEVIADNAVPEPVAEQEAEDDDCDCADCPDRDDCVELNKKPTVN